MVNEFNRPIFILKGENYLRYLSILFLITIIILSIYSIQVIGYTMILVVIAAVFGLICIRFPFLYLFKDHFIIEKKGIIKRISDKEIYRYKEIKEIEFEEGNIDWSRLIVQTLLGQGAMGGFSKADQIKLTLLDEKKVIIYRFGSKENFKLVINMLQKEIKPST